MIIPPAATNILVALANRRPGGPGNSDGRSVTAALNARLASLQAENDELYELLKRGTVTRLQEEAKELRVVTGRLESALKGMRSPSASEIELLWRESFSFRVYV